jgi:hypothetical protein
MLLVVIRKILPKSDEPPRDIMPRRKKIVILRSDFDIAVTARFNAAWGIT